MKISHKSRSLKIGEHQVDICRNKDGVMQLWADTDIQLAAGLGYAHAHDRLVQMVLVRLVGQGRLSECLQADEETLNIDIFARGMGFRHDAEQDVANLGPEARQYVEAYVRGVNAALTRNRRPLEFILVGHRPEPWTVADTMITVKLMTYVGLAQTQQDFEKFIVQAIRGGVSLEKLRRLVSPYLDGLDDATVSLIRDVRWVDPLLPKEIRFLTALPNLSASNNWAVTGSRTRTGSPLICFDPHMEVNRLPAVWYESVMNTSTDYRVGITMPGVPGVVMGRTRDLAFGFTYGYMDMVDYFIEDCQDGRYRRGDQWFDLDTRTENIVRKGTDPVQITIRSTPDGVIEADPGINELPDGLYLARAWSNQTRAASPALEALYQIFSARSVPEAQQILKNVTISCNWILADRDGNIGYQQSGRLPARKHSGLFPVPGWDAHFAWEGAVDPDRLHSILNPREGYLATANDELNPPGGPVVINLPMGSYRADRIRSVLAETDPVDIQDMERLQLDLFSLQAHRIMNVVRPLLPEVPAAAVLRDWDLRYNRSSVGATLFEEVYEALLADVFGEGMFGTEAWTSIASSTTVVADYYHLFDDAVLSDDPIWFGEHGREASIARVLDSVLRNLDPTIIQTWGERRSMVLRNIVLGGKLPIWLGFDQGPVELEGNRATVVQGQLFTAYGRSTSFGVSWRFITDMAQDEAATVIPGGPSGRRFSKWYRSEVDRWLRGEYKTLRPKPLGEVEK